MKAKEKLIIGDFIDGSAIVYKKEKMNLVKGLMFENRSIGIRLKISTFSCSYRNKNAAILGEGISQFMAKIHPDFIGTTALAQTKSMEHIFNLKKVMSTATQALSDQL